MRLECFLANQSHLDPHSLTAISPSTVLRQVTSRSVLMALALFMSLMSVGIQSLPAGSVLCMEQGGHFAWENSANVCCQSMIDADGDGIPDPPVPQSGVISCKHCTDFYMPHDRFDLGQAPTADVSAVVGDLPLVAIIDWPVTRAVPRLVGDTFARSPHLIRIATTVIRC
jgi:hypothetical protein